MHMNRDMNRPALRVDASAYPAGAALLSASGVPDVAPVSYTHLEPVAYLQET